MVDTNYIALVRNFINSGWPVSVANTVRKDFAEGRINYATFCEASAIVVASYKF